MPAGDFWREIRDYNRALWRWWLRATRAHRSRGVHASRLTELVSNA
jgi:hypothetical protein